MLCGGVKPCVLQWVSERSWCPLCSSATTANAVFVVRGFDDVQILCASNPDCEALFTSVPVTRATQPTFHVLDDSWLWEQSSIYNCIKYKWHLISVNSSLTSVYSYVSQLSNLLFQLLCRNPLEHLTKRDFSRHSPSMEALFDSMMVLALQSRFSFHSSFFCIMLVYNIHGFILLCLCTQHHSTVFLES